MQIWKVISIWLSIEKRIDFAIMKLIYNGLNKKNMLENLQSNVVKVKRTSRKASLTLISEDENILVQSVYFKEIRRILSDLTKCGKKFGNVVYKFKTIKH